MLLSPSQPLSLSAAIIMCPWVDTFQCALQNLMATIIDYLTRKVSLRSRHSMVANRTPIRPMKSAECEWSQVLNLGTCWAYGDSTLLPGPLRRSLSGLPSRTSGSTDVTQAPPGMKAIIHLSECEHCPFKKKNIYINGNRPHSGSLTIQQICLEKENSGPLSLTCSFALG